MVLAEGEGYRIEFKEQMANLDKEFVAFANASGGFVFLWITGDYGTGLNSDKSTYHKGLKVEDFGKVSLLRNPNIANLMQRIEYIQKMATVIDYVREIMNLQYP